MSDTVNTELQKIEFILLQSQMTLEPIELSHAAFQSACNIFAHAIMDRMGDMVMDLDVSESDHEALVKSFADDLAFIVKQYTNIKPNTGGMEV